MKVHCIIRYFLFGLMVTACSEETKTQIKNTGIKPNVQEKNTTNANVLGTSSNFFQNVNIVNINNNYNPPNIPPGGSDRLPPIPSIAPGNCQPSATTNKFYVYRNDIKDYKYVWANIMPARAIDTDAVNFDLNKTPGFDGNGTAAKITFNLEPVPNWVGLVVPIESGYWGDGYNAVAPDLRKSKKLVFNAKGERGGEKIQVQASFTKVRAYHDYPDSSETAIKTEFFPLSSNWETYCIPISNSSELSRVISLFAVISRKNQNSSGEITFYLDEIYYELEN